MECLQVKMDLPAARKKLGLSQSNLARVLGVSESTIKRIERGTPVPGYAPRLFTLAVMFLLEHPDTIK